MANKLDFKNLAANLEKAAKGALDATIHAADQNDDGKFDKEDISAIADSMGCAVKSGAQALIKNAAKQKLVFEEKSLQPIFASQFTEQSFRLPPFIRVAPIDKKHAESEVCKDSIGYSSQVKGFPMVTLFSESVPSLGLNFFPDHNYEFYYVDPSDHNTYIALDQYFAHLKEACVAELRKIAQDLGAKHFRVTYKEEQATFSQRKVKARGKAAAVAAADNEYNISEKKFSTVEIAAESTFPGHAPSKPQLKYLRRNSNIQSLIDMRMDASSPLLHDKYTISLSSSSGISEKEALNIDAVLKGLKCIGNASVAAEVKSECRKSLDYEIDF